MAGSAGATGAKVAAGVGAGLLAAGAASVTYGAIHAHAYTVRRRTLLIPAGTQLPSLRILHISDAHTLPRHTKRLNFIHSLAEYAPDLVIATGDMFASAESLEPVVTALDPLLDVPGAFVFGSNDYVAPQFKNPFRYLLGPSNRKARVPNKNAQDDDGRARGKSRRSKAGRAPRRLPWRDFRDALTTRGWLDLTNTRGTLSTAGWDLEFVGVDDPHMHLDVYPAAGAAPAGSAPAQAAADGAAEGRTGGAATNGRATGVPKDSAPTHMRIGVTHAPYLRVLDEMAADGCQLIFAGHTHGGQVCLPGGRALVSNCDLDPKYARGLFPWPLPDDADEQGYPLRGDGAVVHEGDPQTWVQVSAGIGAATYMPLRTFCPPEAILLDVIPL